MNKKLNIPNLIDKLIKISKTSIFKNASALLILQAVNTILPLIIMPYMIKVLGFDGYGVYSFAFAISMYLVIVTDFGFGFTGVKLVSVNRDNSIQLSRIFHSIQIIKLFLVTVVLLIYTFLILFLKQFTDNKLLFFLSFGIVIGQSMIPVWFFHGMEKMKYITVINVLIRTIFALSLLYFVNSPDDIELAIFAQSFSFLFAGLSSIIIVYQKFKLPLVLPKFSFLYRLFIDSRHMYFSTLSISMYTNANIIILGFYTGNTEVGVYAAVEKIIRAVQSLMSPISQALFPHISKDFAEISINKAIRKIYKISKYYLIILIIISIALILVLPFVRNLLDIDQEGFIKVFYMMLPIVTIGSLNYLMGVVGLVNLNKDKLFSRATFIGGIFNVILCFVFVKMYGALGVAFSLTIAELVTLVFIISCFHRLNSNHIKS